MSSAFAEVVAGKKAAVNINENMYLIAENDSTRDLFERADKRSRKKKCEYSKRDLFRKRRNSGILWKRTHRNDFFKAGIKLLILSAPPLTNRAKRIAERDKAASCR